MELNYFYISEKKTIIFLWLQKPDSNVTILCKLWIICIFIAFYNVLRHEKSCHLVKEEREVGTLFHSVSAQCICGKTEVICPSHDRNTTWLRQIGDSQPVPLSSNSRYYSNMKWVISKHTHAILGRTESLCIVIEIPARICSNVIKDDCFHWLVFGAYRCVI